MTLKSLLIANICQNDQQFNTQIVITALLMNKLIYHDQPTSNETPLYNGEFHHQWSSNHAWPKSTSTD